MSAHTVGEEFVGFEALEGAPGLAGKLLRAGPAAFDGTIVCPHFWRIAVRLYVTRKCVIFVSMRTATIREAQHHLSKLIRELDSGGEIILTRRGRKIATLTPYRDPDEGEVVFPNFGRLRRELGTDSLKGANAILRMREESG